MAITRHYPVIIIGGGTFGTAAAWALAQRGVKSLVIEQFDHVHSMGSHSGKTRVIRHAYAEGSDYVPLVLRADAMWLELEDQLNEKILYRTGSVELDAHGHGHAELAKASADAHGLPYEWIDAAEVRRRWTAINVDDSWHAGFDPNAGFLMIEPALRGMANLAIQLGAEFITGTTIKTWGSTGSDAWVRTGESQYSADQLIIAGGAWMPELLEGLGLPIVIQRKVLFWLDVDAPERFGPDRFPVFLTDSSHGEIYGFPILADEGLKIARHDGGDATTANSVDRTVRAGEASEVLPLAQSLFRGVTGGVISSLVCLYTRTPDTNFIIDRHPAHENVVIAAGFSGHGFKFAPAIGQMLADMTTDTNCKTMPLFAMSRLIAAV